MASITEFSSRAEGAAAAGLHKVRALADAAPMGRAFAAIASLTEVSRRIEGCLEAGDQALARGDATVASLELSRASVLMERMRKLSDSIDVVEAAVAEPKSARG